MSRRYSIAVALLDGAALLKQFSHSRINADDVWNLVAKTEVRKGLNTTFAPTQLEITPYVWRLHINSDDAAPALAAINTDEVTTARGMGASSSSPGRLYNHRLRSRRTGPRGVGRMG